jgi:hypothetical protein
VEEPREAARGIEARSRTILELSAADVALDTRRPNEADH